MAVILSGRFLSNLSLAPHSPQTKDTITLFCERSGLLVHSGSLFVLCEAERVLGHTGESMTSI